jgi:ribosome-binding protein aMBF1 (putative translation factor)
MPTVIPPTITNNRQYKITRAQVHRFEEALSRADEQYRDADPVLRKAMQDQITSQLDELREQVREYEELRAAKDFEVEVDSLEELKVALVQARIASGLTQKDLAERLGVPSQVIQRYEARFYAGASVERLQAVAQALGGTVTATIALAPRGSEEPSAT